jgi:hypothetical protein
LGTNAAGFSIGLTASLAERQPLVIESNSEIVMKLCTMGSALVVAVNPKVKASPQQTAGRGQQAAGSKQLVVRTRYYVLGSGNCHFTFGNF